MILTFFWKTGNHKDGDKKKRSAFLKEVLLFCFAFVAADVRWYLVLTQDGLKMDVDVIICKGIGAIMKTVEYWIPEIKRENLALRGRRKEK